MTDLTSFPNLPERIGGLGKLAYNLWWTWHPGAQNLFRTLHLQAWHESGHNPVRMLTSLPFEVLAQAAADPKFLMQYHAVMDQFNVEISSRDRWFTERHGRPDAPIAYFSAEYGLHASLPVYAGGLGVLAGDYLKECSDLGVPLVAVGLTYSHGYVCQRMTEDGWQEELPGPLDRSDDPITPVLAPDGQQLVISIPLFDPPVHAAVWKASVSRVTLYLLDTDLEINQHWDRNITHHLYASNLEQRLRQEIVLGIGGVLALRALGIHPAAIHLNEGHPAFAALERLRGFVHEGCSFDDAFRRARETTVFTTHTPIPAGTDIFQFSLMDKYFSNYYPDMAINRDTFLGLGTNPQDPHGGFNMTVLGLRVSAFVNGVSHRHGEVARDIWSGIWPGWRREDVPIVGITNGIHLPSWIDPLWIQPLFDRYLGPSWRANQDQPGVWDRVRAIPDGELWDIHAKLKARMIEHVDERARRRQQDSAPIGSAISSGALLNPNVLTIGFARRFTSYKRPDLLLHDFARLRRMLTDPWMPIQIIFAGKSYPTDMDGKRIVQRIFRLAEDPDLAGRVVFVEDYDQQLAGFLVRGVDLWLNNPIPPLEASGTSGMKASVNGVPNLSILDGWWLEGYNGSNGWGFGREEIFGDRNPSDAEAIYRLLEEQIIPLYYARSDDGVPHGYVKVMKNAIASVAPEFGTRRMVKEYSNKFYVRALGLAPVQTQQPTRVGIEELPILGG